MENWYGLVSGEPWNEASSNSCVYVCQSFLFFLVQHQLPVLHVKKMRTECVGSIYEEADKITDCSVKG